MSIHNDIQKRAQHFHDLRTLWEAYRTQTDKTVAAAFLERWVELVHQTISPEELRTLFSTGTLVHDENPVKSTVSPSRILEKLARENILAVSPDVIANVIMGLLDA